MSDVLVVEHGFECSWVHGGVEEPKAFSCFRLDDTPSLRVMWMGGFLAIFLLVIAGWG